MYSRYQGFLLVSVNRPALSQLSAVEPLILEKGIFYVLQKRRATDFEAPKTRTSPDSRFCRNQPTVKNVFNVLI